MDARGSKRPKLVIPHLPKEGDEGHYDIHSIEEKFVKDYSGHDFDRIEELNIFEYWLLLRDSVIWNHMQTEEGRKYLEDCWRMEQTTPDRKRLRDKFGK